MDVVLLWVKYSSFNSFLTLFPRDVLSRFIPVPPQSVPQADPAPTLRWPPGGRTASMGSGSAAATTRCTEPPTRSGAPEAPRSCSTTTGSPALRTSRAAATCTTQTGHRSSKSRWGAPEVPLPPGRLRSPADRLPVGRWGGTESEKG